MKADVDRFDQHRKGKSNKIKIYKSIPPPQRSDNAALYMLIEIEFYFGNHVLHGRKLKISEIKAFMNEIADARDFVPLFCARFGYEELPYDPYLHFDLTVDLDTARIISYKAK